MDESNEVNVFRSYRKCVLDLSESLDTQIDEENTIYIINDVFDLEEKNIVVPNGCVIYFNGGGLYNGKLIGTNTRIVAPFGRIFGPKLVLSGTFFSDDIRVSWWVSLGANDNTCEVQSALNSISSFINRNFIFDIPVRITDVSYSLKYFPGTSFTGVSNSHQNHSSITVFGTDSQGLDISGTEMLQFENLLFIGDEQVPPKSLLFASRLKKNKQTNKHCFRNVSFRGRVIKSFIYNYGGEEWVMENCDFFCSEPNEFLALFYATSVNDGGCVSKFQESEKRVTSVTYTTFNQCHFMNSSMSPSVFFEGGVREKGKINTIASIYFNQCYFNNVNTSSVRMKNISGAISFINNIDESGSVNATKRKEAFFSFEGENLVDCVTFINNTIYAKQQTPIVYSSPTIEKYFASSNKIINNGAIWLFTTIRGGIHCGLSKSESFIVTGSAEDVEVKSIE